MPRICKDDELLYRDMTNDDGIPLVRDSAETTLIYDGQLADGGRIPSLRDKSSCNDSKSDNGEVTDDNDLPLVRSLLGSDNILGWHDSQ